MTLPRPLRARRAPISEVEWLFFLDSIPDDKEAADYTDDENLDLYRLETRHDINAPMRRPTYDERNFDYTEKRWHVVRGDVLAHWIEHHPGSRPTAWWKFEAHEPRKPRETQAMYLTRMGLWAPGEKAWKRRLSRYKDQMLKWAAKRRDERG